MIDAQTALAEAAARADISLLRLSRLLGRNEAYLAQFVQRGSPRRLAERDRRILADYLAIDETALGGPAASAVAIRRLDVVASAGPGAVNEGEEAAHVEQFPTAMLRRLALDPATLTLIVARGDSMLPTIADGDDILVDTGDRRVGRRPAIYVLRIDGVVIVKRLHATGGQVMVVSDNPAAPAIAPIAIADCEVVGRVVWLGRKLS